MRALIQLFPVGVWVLSEKHLNTYAQCMYIVRSIKGKLQTGWSTLEPKCNERSDPLWNFSGDNSSLYWIIKFRKKQDQRYSDPKASNG